MSYRILVLKQLTALSVCLCLALQGAYMPAAHADEADEFIAKTHRLADGLATSTVNMMLLSALQQSVFMSGGDPTAALQAMRDQTTILRGLGAQLNRTYGVATDGTANFSGERLSQLYRDYVTTMSKITNQKLKIDGIRRDAYAFRALMLNLADSFTKNLEDRCREGYSVNPYDEIRPALQAIMPNYEVRLSFEFGGGQSPHLDPSKSGVSIGKTDEEKALWAVFYAGSVILSTYAITGTWVLTTQAFSSLALGTQMAALGMALGIGLAVAAIIVAVQISQARDAAKKAVEQQRRMFDNRADHNSVNKYFKEKCNAAVSEFSGLRSQMAQLASGDAASVQALEDSRVETKAKIKSFVAALEAYVEARKRILGDGFEAKPKEEQAKLLGELDKTDAAKEFLKVSQQLNPKDMAGMIMFIMKDLYHGGVKYSAQLETAFQKTVSVINSGRAEERANLLRLLAGQKNLEEIQLRTAQDLKAELRQASDLAEIYSDLDLIVVELAEVVFSGGETIAPKIRAIETRIANVDQKIQHAYLRHPESELLKVLDGKMRQTRAATKKAEVL